MTVRIVTDSTCDLPADFIAQHAISVIPLHIRVGDSDYLDGIDMTRAEFYEKLPHFDHHPTTAVPSFGKFYSIYNALAAEGASEIISIHICSSLSATVNVARTAAAEIDSAPVFVFDSHQLSLGTGFLVQIAAEMAEAGCNAKEIMNAMEKQIKNTHVWAMLDTLQFLRRSGRMSRVVSTIGDLIEIKPMLWMYDGVSGVKKIRTRKNGLAHLVELLEKYSPFEKIAFLHSAAFEEAQALKTRVEKLLPNKEIWFELINPVLGAHIGPGVVGFACVSQER